MYLGTINKHPHVNSNQILIIVYKIHYLKQSRSMTSASISGLTMSSLINPMTRGNLDTNIISYDRNLIIMISSRFPSCYVICHGLH